MKAINYHYWGDVDTIKRLVEEYRDYCGRNVRMLAPDHLVVFALPPAKPSKKKKNAERDEDENKTNRKPQRREQASKSGVDKSVPI